MTIYLYISEKMQPRAKHNGNSIINHPKQADMP